MQMIRKYPVPNLAWMYDIIFLLKGVCVMLSKFILFILTIVSIALFIFCAKLYLKMKNIEKKSITGLIDTTLQKDEINIEINAEENSETKTETYVDSKGQNYNELIKEKNSLQSCYDEKLKEIENLNNRIKYLENLETENKNLIDKINIQTKEIENLNNRIKYLENLETENKNLTDKINIQTKEIEEYKIKINSIKNQISRFSDKSLKSTFLFANGQKEGEEKIFFKGEALLNKIKNWHDGILEGPSTVFYKTGEKYIEMYYKNGKIDGSYIVYNKDGSIKETYSYKDGVAYE